MSDELDYNLDRDGARPLYEQLRDQIANRIREGALAPGARLPATRTLCDELGVNRATVVEAYRRLEDDGLVEQRVGSGTYVRALPGLSGAPIAPGGPRASRALRAFEQSRQAHEPPPVAEGAIDLTRIAPDQSTFRTRELGEILARVLAERGGEALSYGATAGDTRLREAVAKRLSDRGLPVEPVHVLIVSGAQQGLDLIFRSLLDPGDVVVTESPTYHLVLDLLRLHQAEIAPVPVLPQPGRPGLATLDWARLEQLLARRPAALYTAPTFQNPTGLTLDLESRRRLASLCKAASVLIVEDDYEADLRYEGEALPPIAALSEAGEVVYVGTLSKALMPGLRLGWVVARPDVLARIAQVKRTVDLSGAPLLQAAAAELISSGAYDRHLAAVIAENRERMRALALALESALPRGCTVTAPLGGHALWVGLPEGLTGAEVARRAAARGVAVSEGEAFLPAGAGGAGLRLSIARASREDIPRGAKLLADAIRESLADEKGRESRRREHLERPLNI